MISGRLQRLACVLMAGGLLWTAIPAAMAQEDVQSLMNQAGAAVQRGDFGTAEKQYRKVLRETPNDPNAQMGLATALLANHRRSEARIILEALLSRNPGFQPAYYLLGVIHETEGDLAGAKAAYQSYVSTSPSSVSTDPQVRIKLRQMGVF